MWVWGGGLDVQPTSSSGLESGISPDRASRLYDAAYKVPIEPDPTIPPSSKGEWNRVPHEDIKVSCSHVRLVHGFIISKRQVPRSAEFVSALKRKKEGTLMLANVSDRSRALMPPVTGLLCLVRSTIS